MKLRKADNVIVIAGRDKGKTGKVLSVIPTENKVLVEGINVSKRHTKPSQKLPRGGILDVTKPIDVSKVMVVDPTSGKPARIGYVFNSDGTKERIFKVSSSTKTSAKKAKPAEKKTAESKTKEAESDKGAKAGKK
jgi:large subunit ribosomal protein L24